MLIETGSYSGDGVDGRTISFTGNLLGKTPTVVFMKSNQGDPAVWSSSTMTAGYSGYFDSGTANVLGMIKSLVSGGFTVGTDVSVNASGETYYWCAIYDDGNGDFKAFSYTGTGVDNENFDIVGFQPNFVFIKRDGPTGGVAKFEEQVTDVSFTFSASPTSADVIQAFRTLGFQVGTLSGVNVSGNTYHGFAFKSVDGAIDSHTYVGDGTDNRDIVVQGTSFTPDLVILKRDYASQFLFSFAIATDSTLIFDGGSWPTANMIQARNSTGFQVGSDAASNTSADTYYYLAAKNNPVSSASKPTPYFVNLLRGM